MLEKILGCAAAADFFERSPRLRKIREYEFFRQRDTFRKRSRSGARERLVRTIDQREMAHVGHRGTIANRIDIERRRDAPPQKLEALANRRRNEHRSIVSPCGW